MASGEGFAAYEQRVLVPIMEFWGWGGWKIHCGLSALEHLFRLGAKEGEEETDWAAFLYWSNGCEKQSAWKSLVDDIMFERKKVGR